MICLDMYSMSRVVWCVYRTKKSDSDINLQMKMYSLDINIHSNDAFFRCWFKPSRFCQTILNAFFWVPDVVHSLDFQIVVGMWIWAVLCAASNQTGFFEWWIKIEIGRWNFNLKVRLDFFPWLETLARTMFWWSVVFNEPYDENGS